MGWFKKAVETCESETIDKYLSRKMEELSRQLRNAESEIEARGMQVEALQRRMRLLLEHLDLREEFKSTQYMAIQPGGMQRLQTLETDHRLEKIKRCKTCQQEIE